MGKFLSRVRDLDSFGMAVSVNYRGDSMYRTLPGAFLTLILKVFILVFTILSVLELLAHRNPNVSQVSLPEIISARYGLSEVT